MTRFEQAAQKFEFRKRGRKEDRSVYAAKVIAHVATRDIAAAHELRCGRPQAEWTPDDVQAFDAHVKAMPRASHDHVKPAYQILETGPFATTDESVLACAHVGFNALCAMRERDPLKSLPIFASVLLTSGVLLTAMPGRGDRIGLVKYLAKTAPVVGFFVVFDSFLHAINTTTGTATKTDTILGQVGTRDRRLMFRRSYHVVGGRVQFEAVVETDLRDTTSGISHDDPYAEIFVSVPTSSGAPS